MLGNKHFDDAVAFGGWSLDEHNPGGMLNLEEPPSYFHEDFDEPYQIPFRSLYSANVPNLLFAGRNISQTHIALSSSRIMATCALEGQAVGTAAGLCAKLGVMPRELGAKYMHELQEQLLRDDSFIPYRIADRPGDLVKDAAVVFASSTSSGSAELLADGMSRDYAGKVHHWQSETLPAHIQIEWVKEVALSTVEIKCDTNVKKNIMLRRDSLEDKIYTTQVPKEMLKACHLEARINGSWVQVAELQDNKVRRVRLSFPTVKATAIRVTLLETYGKPQVKLFEIRCYA